MSSYLYLIFFAVITAFCSVDKRISKRHLFYVSIVIIPILTIFAGFRVIGLDYDAYVEHFESVPKILEYSRTDLSMELGYELFVSLCKQFSNSFHVFLVSFTLLSLIAAFALCYRVSPYPLLSFYMFFSYSFFTQIMGQMRQPIAIVLALSGLVPLILSHRRGLACLWIIVSGILFHKSLFFLLPFIFIADLKLNRIQMSIFCCIALFLYFSLPSVIDSLVKLIPTNIYLYDTINAYLSYKAISITFTLGMVERVGMTALLLYYGFKYRIYATNQLFRLFTNLYLMGVCIYFIFISVSSEFASRGTQSMTYALFFAMPILLKYVRPKEKYVILGIILVWGMYVSLGFMDDIDIYVPYKSIML